LEHFVDIFNGIHTLVYQRVAMNMFVNMLYIYISTNSCSKLKWKWKKWYV